jgi:uncharacterized protein (DUF924 family)
MDMNPIRYLVISGSFFCFSVYALVPVSPALIHKAAQTMNGAEMQNMRDYLEDSITASRTGGDTLRAQALERIQQQFYKGHYTLVMQELKALGEDPQDILRTTALRAKMFSGELEQFPWFMREIAGVDWLFAQDAQKATKQWPQPKDKALYLIYLVDQLERNHARVVDRELLDDAITELVARLDALRLNIPGVFKRQIENALARLDTIRELRDL